MTRVSPTSMSDSNADHGPPKALDVRALTLLWRYAAGEVSVRHEAKEMGPCAGQHDVLASIVAAHLAFPLPPSDEVAREVAAQHARYGRHRPRRPG